MDEQEQQLRTRLAEIAARVEAIQALADGETRDMTEEEQVEFDNLSAEFGRVESAIARHVRANEMKARAGTSQGRRVAPAPTAAQVNDPNPEPQAAAQPAPQTARQGAGLRNTNLLTVQERGRWGFAHPGEFFSAVRQAKVKNQIDPRLIQNAMSTYGNESVGEDGGFAVPPDWRADIMSLVGGEDSLLPMTDQQTTSSNQIVLPVDEKAPWHSNGVRAYWVDEAGALTQSKPVLKPMTVRAHKLGALVYLTDELLEDASAMGRYVQTKAPAAIMWAVNNALVNGTGAGTPLGLLNSPALVTVSKEGSQAADTLVGMNILKMYARMPAASRRRAVWLINQDLEPQLMSLNVAIKNVAGTENVGGTLVYMPPGGLSAAPYGTLLGRPIIPTEACGGIGDLGDIFFWDPMGYMSVVKAGGVRAEASIHVEFEKDVTAFRFLMRVGGQPWLSAPIARNASSNTLSTIVTLEAR